MDDLADCILSKMMPRDSVYQCVKFRTGELVVFEPSAYCKEYTREMLAYVMIRFNSMWRMNEESVLACLKGAAFLPYTEMKATIFVYAYGKITDPMCVYAQPDVILKMMRTCVPLLQCASRAFMNDVNSMFINHTINGEGDMSGIHYVNHTINGEGDMSGFQDVN
jgi:hypothetical protein